MLTKFLEFHANVLKGAIIKGTITENSPLIKEYIDKLVDMLCMLYPSSNKIDIDAKVSKHFEDELGFEV